MRSYRNRYLRIPYIFLFYKMFLSSAIVAVPMAASRINNDLCRVFAVGIGRPLTRSSYIF